MGRRLVAFVIALVSICLSVKGQELPMLHFTNNDGLPGNTVYVIYRDKKGCLWFGTDKGIARYNGLKFEVFTTLNGLPDNEIFQFCEDLYGRLWLVSFSGELCYYQDGKFHTPDNTPFLRLKLPLRHVKLVSPQKDSSLIVVFHNRLRFLDVGADHCQFVDVTKVDEHYKYGDLLYREKIAGNRYKLTFTNTTIIVDTLMNIKQQLDVDTFRMDAGGNMQMFSSCQDQEFLFNSGFIYTGSMALAGKFPTGFHTKAYVNKIFFTNGGKFYATNNGLYINDSIHVLKDHNISSITCDKYGDYWVSTINDGVYVIRNKFGNSNLTTGRHEGRILYATTVGHTLYFAPADNNFYCQRGDSLARLISYTDITQRNPFPGSTQIFLLDDSLRYFQFAADEMIYKANVFDKKVVVKSTDIAQGARSAFSKDGYLYLQKPDAILRLPIDSLLSSSPVYTRIGTSVKDSRILWMTRDNKGELWYSTMRGIYRISPGGTTSRQPLFEYPALKTFEFIHDDVVAYTTSNLLVLLRRNGTGYRIDTVKSDDCIWDKMYKLNEDRVLLSTNNMYRSLNTWETGTIDDFGLITIADPFLPIQPEAVVADDSICYFLKSGKVSRFNKWDLIAIPPPPRAFFTVLRSGDSVYKIGDEVTIPYGDSKNMVISFGVVAPVLANVECQYSVSKSDKDYWTPIEGQDISLVISAYGNYTVKVRVRTASSQFSKPVEFTLRVKRPFWVRWWFIVLEAGALVWLIVFLSRRRLAYILNKRDKRHEMQVRFLKSEYKALNALMNPHFVFNTLNNVQSLINNNDKLAANEYLRVIADLVRQNMHNISKELIPLQKEIDLISNYMLLEKFRFKERLSYEIIVDKGLDTSEIMIPPLLIQPLVENSIKHGILPLTTDDGAIYLNIFERRGDLCIEVKDNGVGLNQKKSDTISGHESFGLKNIQTRIEQLSIIQNKEISFEIKEKPSANGRNWTVATIVIPLDDENS